jgi:hypothetical protein
VRNTRSAEKAVAELNSHPLADPTCWSTQAGKKTVKMLSEKMVLAKS